MLDPGVRAEVRDVVGQLVECAAAQAREAGRQLRCILRLWLLAEEDREIEWVASASEGLMPFEAAERVETLPETADQLLLDVADEIGAALNLPSGTALDRIREALVLGLHLPESLAELAAGATCWHRILTHPVTGAVPDHDRTAYAVPTGRRRRLRHRDGTCRFPGCRRRAERCDLDHTVAWQDEGGAPPRTTSRTCAAAITW